MEFAGKIGLVTGATSGIGKETTRTLAENGAKVFAVGRREELLQDLAESAGGGEIVPVAGDLTSDSFRKDLARLVENDAGGLDVLVNAAGILEGGDWDATDLDAWDRTMDINLRSLFALTKEMLPLIVKVKGSIVNVSSVTGTRAFPGVLAYCVSKAGVDQFTRCLALELAPKGVRVNAVNPGVVKTELHRAGGMAEDAYAKFLEHSKDTHPLGRVGEPHEVAQAILFLASSRAAWITGDNLAVDGGRAQTCAR